MEETHEVEVEQGRRAAILTEEQEDFTQIGRSIPSIQTRTSDFLIIFVPYS